MAAAHAKKVETPAGNNFRVVAPESPWADATSSAVLSLAVLRAGRRQKATKRQIVDELARQGMISVEAEAVAAVRDPVGESVARLHWYGGAG